MARFYATFGNTTNSALEAASGSNWYQRKAFTDGTTLRNALISARTALSSAVYGQLDAVNRNGAAGVYWPVGSFSIGGGNLSWTSIRKTTAAEWPSDPRVRPTAPLTDGTTVTDGGTVTASLYTDAITALGNAFAGIADGGPYGRLGLNQWRTLASIWHDHDLTFLAWDDFTPGQVQTLSTAEVGGAGSYAVTVQWVNYQFLNDENSTGKIRVQASLAGANNYSYDSGLIAPPSTKLVTWNSTPIAGTYTLEAFVQVFDATISTHGGTIASVSKTVTIS
jgi:hypothetical protein